MPTVRKLTAQEIIADESRLTIAELRAAKLVMSKIRKQVSNDSDYYFDKPIEEFYTAMSLLPSQSYGSRIQRRLALRLNLGKVSSRDAKGDLVSNDGKYYEVKASLSNDGREYNVVQVRLHHDIDGYYFVFVDISSDIPQEQIYLIPALDLHDVAVTWEYAHGNKAKKSESDLEDERRKTIKVGDSTWLWLQQYRIEVI